MRLPVQTGASFVALPTGPPRKRRPFYLPRSLLPARLRTLCSDLHFAQSEKYDQTVFSPGVHKRHRRSKPSTLFQFSEHFGLSRLALIYPQ